MDEYLYHIDDLAEHLTYDADWRRQKSEEYPRDPRNLEAANRLLLISNDLKNAYGSQPHIDFSRMTTTTSDDEWLQYLEIWADYRRKIGFSEFPSSGEDYLRGLVMLFRSLRTSIN